VKGVFEHWPNRITALRFVGALVLFVLFSVMDSRDLGDELPLFGEALEMQTVILFCFWLFVVVASTDFLDGYLARKGNQVSVFGRIADPFVDKVLILGTMIFLCVMPWSRERMPPWLVVVILAREFLVTGIRSYVESIGKEFSADWAGKVKMIVQCMAVGGVMWIPAYPWPSAWFAFWDGLVSALIYTTLIATIGSGLSYVLRMRRILSEVGR